jgi:hypothetical protein
MFHSEALARAIHDDRVREIERTTRERLLLQASDDVDAAAVAPGHLDRSHRASPDVARVDQGAGREAAWRTPA